MSVYQKLLAVQTELKAPKDKNNDFGKYKYRSFESICEAVKEHLNTAKATINVTDDVVMIGERYYIKATATFVDIETGESVSNTAFAREPLNKKGMDDSQITGTASSYARKYAMNGLLLIDDTKDADTNEYHEEAKNRYQKEEQQAAQQQQTQKTAQVKDPANWVDIQTDPKTGRQICKIWIPKSRTPNPDWAEINGWPTDYLINVTKDQHYKDAVGFINHLIDTRSA